MIVGIIGLGVIGKANKDGFEHNLHNVVVHDLGLGTDIKNILGADLIYLCLPTPSAQNGDCDTSIIEGVIKQLGELKYLGPVVIRSTVPPGFTNMMKSRNPDLIIGFAPEFLRERCATEDFITNHNLLAIGSDDKNLIDLVIDSHGSLPKNIQVMSSTEAELLKYYNNVYAALRITFANNIYELATKLNCNYNLIKNTYLLTKKSSGNYLDASESVRGFGGACLPKDTAALKNFFDDMGIQVDLFTAVLRDNAKYKATVFAGMRP
jgi:UDPglucose 6-dehydrogenase